MVVSHFFSTSSRWLSDQERTDCTWRRLIDVLKKSGRRALAEDIEEVLRDTCMYVYFRHNTL